MGWEWASSRAGDSPRHQLWGEPADPALPVAGAPHFPPLSGITHRSSADVAQGVPSGPVPAVSRLRLVSTLFAAVAPCRTKSVPMSGDAAGRSACATDCPTHACEKCGYPQYRSLRWDRPSPFVVCHPSQKGGWLTDDKKRSSVPPGVCLSEQYWGYP
jgi:hypothetical protein